MTKNTKKRYHRLMAIADQALKDHGIDISASHTRESLQGVIDTIQQHDNCDRRTAQTHAFRAVWRARGDRSKEQTRGGARPGAGRKAHPEAKRVARSFTITKRADGFVALYALKYDCSESEAVDRIIREHVLFVPYEYEHEHDEEQADV